MANGVAGRPFIFETPQKLEEAIREYFERCEERDVPITMSGLAFHLGVCRQTIINYKNRDEFKHLIERARLRVEASMEERMLQGSINVTGAIFSLKNNFSWSDKHEVIAETNNTNVNVNREVDLSHLSVAELKELMKNED